MVVDVAPVLVGALLAWSLAALPGPANALIATESVRRGALSAMTTGLGAVTADFAMFLLMWLGVVRAIEAFPWLRVALGAVGAVLLLRFAWGAYRAAKAPADADAGRGSFVKCFLVIVTSPLNWVWWASAGTTIFTQFGFAVVFGFFGGLLAWIAFWTWLTREGARRVRRFSEGVSYVSAGVLALFAVVTGWAAVATALRLV